MARFWPSRKEAYSYGSEVRELSGQTVGRPLSIHYWGNVTYCSVSLLLIVNNKLEQLMQHHEILIFYLISLCFKFC
jgi:hypothetical protein